MLVVGLTEQRQRTDLASLGQRHDVRADVQVLANRLVRRLLDVCTDLLAEPALPSEVEPQVARFVVRAALQRGWAQYLPERRVHDVSSRVRLAGTEAPFTINRRQHLDAAEQLTLLDPYPMHDQAFHRALHIDDLKLNAITDDPAGVGVLAA